MLPGKKYAITDILAMVRRRWALLVVPPLATLFLALVYSASLPNIYESEVLVAIIPQRVPDRFVQSTVTLRTEDRLDAMTTQVKSRTVLEELISELDLYPNERARMPMEDVVNLMRNDINVVPEAPRRGPNGPMPLHAFHVFFKYKDAAVSARVADRLASIYVDQNARDRGALAENTNQFLEGQLTEARARLEAQEAKLKNFRQLHGNSLPSQVASSMQVAQSTQMQIQALVEAIARDRDRRMMLERLYAEAQREPIPTVPTPAAPAQTQAEAGIPAGGTARQQLATAREQLARLELRLTPQHPDVIRMKRIITELDVKAADEATAAAAAASATTPNGSAPTVAVVSPAEAARRERLAQMNAEIESLSRQTTFKESEESRLRGLVAEYQQRVDSVPGVESEWVSLSRDYDTQLAAYKELLQRSEAAKVALNLERRQIGEQFRVLDPAKVPLRPASPIRWQINGIGLLIGLGLGFGIAAFLELADSTYRSDQDILAALALPVLATVPHVETASERARRTRRRMIVSAATTCFVTVAGYVFWSLRLWTQVL